jgi:uncharacterized membrane protein YhhN
LSWSIVFLLAAVSSVAGILSEHFWLHDLFTPLATICILALAVSRWRAFRKSYALWISVGLFFSLLGDIALLRAEEYFLPGLVAFLFAHIAYLIAFTRDTKFPARLSVCFPYLFLAAILYLFLLPRLPVALKLPVAVYAICLPRWRDKPWGAISWCVRVLRMVRCSLCFPTCFSPSTGSVRRCRARSNSCSLLSGAVVDGIVH